jgi:hypothetical protein
MFGHLQRDCPEELVECVYHATGCVSECSGKVRRCDFLEHTQDRDTMTVAVAGLFRRVDDLRAEVNALRGNNVTGRRVEMCDSGCVAGRKRSSAESEGR